MAEVEGSGMDAMERLSLAFGSSASYIDKKDELMSKVTALQEALKSGEPIDVSVQIALIMGLMVEIGGDIVQDDADSLTAMDKYMGVAAEIQSILAVDSPNTTVQSINIYTGQPETVDGVPVMVSPDVALERATTYLLNNPYTQYNLDSTGNAIQATDEDGNLVFDPDGNPVWEENAIFSFFENNPELRESMIANAESIVMGLQDDAVGVPTITPGPGGYTLDENGSVVQGEYVTVDMPGAFSTTESTRFITIKPSNMYGGDGEAVTMTWEQFAMDPAYAVQYELIKNSPDGDTPLFTIYTESETTVTPGLIQNMWDKAEFTYSEDGSTVIAGDPAIQQQTMNAVASFNQALTSNSSAIQALAQADAQTLNAQETTLNKFLQAMISMMKSMVQAQKGG